MTGVAVYLAVVVAFAALACGHHGQDWPLAGAWRAMTPRKPLRAPLAPELPPGDSRPATTPQRRTAAHTPTWAQPDKETA